VFVLPPGSLDPRFKSGGEQPGFASNFPGDAAGWSVIRTASLTLGAQILLLPSNRFAVSMVVGFSSLAGYVASVSRDGTKDALGIGVPASITFNPGGVSGISGYGNSLGIALAVVDGDVLVVFGKVANISLPNNGHTSLVISRNSLDPFVEKESFVTLPEVPNYIGVVRVEKVVPIISGTAGEFFAILNVEFFNQRDVRVSHYDRNGIRFSSVSIFSLVGQYCILGDVIEDPSSAGKLIVAVNVCGIPTVLRLTTLGSLDSTFATLHGGILSFPELKNVTLVSVLLTDANTKLVLVGSGNFDTNQPHVTIKLDLSGVVEAGKDINVY
jgi:hypothetical protein